MGNESWSNIGIRWEPFDLYSTDPLSERGGLEMYVNKKKVGHALHPLEKPSNGDWVPMPMGNGPVTTIDEDGEEQEQTWPIMMIGCHRNSMDAEFS